MKQISLGVAPFSDVVGTATIRIYSGGALILHYKTADDFGPATIRARPGGALILTLPWGVNSPVARSAESSLHRDELDELGGGHVTTTAVGFDDPGTETDTSSSTTESDKLTENSDVKDKLDLLDNLYFSEQQTAADGTVTVTDVGSGMQDSLQDEEKDNETDQHGYNSPNANPNSDDVTFDDLETDTEKIQGADEVSVSTYGPVTIPDALGQPGQTGMLFTSNVVGDDYKGTQTDTNEDEGEEVSQTPDPGPGGGEVIGGTGTDAEHDTETDNFTEEDSGDEFAMSNFNETLTDPLTGVKTTIGTSSLEFDKFQDGEKDDDSDKHSSGTGQGSGDDVTLNDHVQSEDGILDGEDLDVSIVGSPSAGVTENISDEITLGGTGDIWDSDTDKGQFDGPGIVAFGSGNSAAATNTDTNVETDGTTSQETIVIADNSTTTSIDPYTGLTTVDTLSDGGKINIGDDQTDMNKDVYTFGQPTAPPGEGEDDFTDDAQQEQTINGTLKSTDTTTVSGTFPDGTTISSTETQGDVSTISLDAQDDKQITETDMSTEIGQDTSDVSQTVDKSDDDIQAQDQTTESLRATISTTDPVTGLKLTVAISDQSGDTATDTDNSQGTNVGTYATGPITPGIAPIGTTTDTESGDDDETQNDSGFTHSRLTITAQGIDAQGESVNLTETATLDDSSSDNGSNDNTITSDGTDADVSRDDETAGGDVTDFVVGTVASFNPTTGVKTTVGFNDLTFSIGSDVAWDAGTATTAANGNSTGSASSSDNFTVNTYWYAQQTTTQTNGDGSTAAPSFTTASAGNDGQSQVNGLWADLGASSAPEPDGSTVPAVSGIAATGTPPSSGSVAQGSTEGGDVLIITGTGFTSDSQVTFDGTAAQTVIVVSGTTIMAVTPAHAAGTAAVVVSNADGASPSGTQSQIIYQAPSNGGGSGSNPITITPPGQVINPAGQPGSPGSGLSAAGSSSGGIFSWLTGKEKGVRTRMAETLAQDGFQSASNPGSQKLDGIIKEVETNKAAAAQVISDPNFMNMESLIAVTNYIGNALGSGFIGKWSGAETNAGGVGISIGLSLTGLDILKDLGDLSHDIAHWKWTWGHVGNTALDLVGTLPLIGVVKEFKHAGELAIATKAAANVGDAAADTAKQVGKAADAAAGVKQAANAAENGLQVIQQSCFVAGTPVLTPGGAKAIEALRPGDLVLSRPESEPQGVIRPRPVEALFKLRGRILEIDVGGRLIQTTNEHPFFVAGQGWVPADKLQLGDLLVGHDGHLTPILRLAQTDRVEDVYNIRVAEDHTYFVGEPEWNFSVWVHNAYSVKRASNGMWQVVDETTGIIHRVRIGTQEAAQKIADGWNKGGVVKAVENQHQLPTQFIVNYLAAGLEIEDYVILLGKDAHRLVKGSLHTGKGVENWNGAWRAFFDGFKGTTGPTVEQILEQLAKMRKDFGLE